VQNQVGSRIPFGIVHTSTVKVEAEAEAGHIVAVHMVVAAHRVAAHTVAAHRVAAHKVFAAHRAAGQTAVHLVFVGSISHGLHSHYAPRSAADNTRNPKRCFFHRYCSDTPCPIHEALALLV